MPNLYPALRRLLFALNEEHAHQLVLRILSGVGRLHPLNTYLNDLFRGGLPACPVNVMGIHFANPLGLAAGWDKDAIAIDGLAMLGFGFVELGTVTPLPQSGNPKPRLFRLRQHDALINRMGFNSAGLNVFLKNLARQQQTTRIGINLGKNSSTAIDSAIEDYLTGLRAVYCVADYITINISSPNTAGLRSLEAPARLDDFLQRLKLDQTRLSDIHSRYVPIVIKLSPDLDVLQLPQVAAMLVEHAIDGVIATNTTTQRPSSLLSDANAAQSGGLSGKPLFEHSTELLAQLHYHLADAVPIIAAGGITSAAEAWQKLAAGASLLQVYTGLVYKGPRLMREILKHIDGQRVARNCTHVSELIDKLHAATGSADAAA